jgi:hypothetical protein
MLQGIPIIMVARIGIPPFVPPNPNNFDYYRRGQPIIGLKAKVDNKGFDYYRRLQPDPAMVVTS